MSQGIDSDAVPAVTVIRPPRGWQLINFAELWHFRDLLYFLAWRDVKVRYKQTLLGVAWAVLQPALMMSIFYIIFTVVTHTYQGERPYPLFVFSALLPWTFFATAIANAGNSVIGSERLITKIYFPRLAVPFATVAASIVDFCVALPLLLILFVCYGEVPGWNILMLPIIFALFVVCAAGVGTLLAALNVAYRDFRYIIPFMVQLWMYATPTIYIELAPSNPASKYPWVQDLLPLNPLTGLIASFRAALLNEPIPWPMLGFSALMAVLFFLVGCFYFRRMEDSFADVI
ncbi:MAG: ABC transporter permease [Planctomycetes bacterium]|jgi:lipopolysaccharide transport system permease protein|nr:ABC transporter permease [Planctomycetota bacterium]